MKKTLLAIALGVACFATNAHARFENYQPNKLKKDRPTPLIQLDLVALADSAIYALEDFNCNYAELLSRVEAKNKSIPVPDMEVARLEHQRPPRLEAPADAGTDQIANYLRPILPRFSPDNFASQVSSTLKNLAEKTTCEISDFAEASKFLAADYINRAASASKREQPMSPIAAADPIRSRGLLEEYQPYDFTVSDRLWIQRLHHDYVAQASDPAEVAFLDQYIRASEAYCSAQSTQNAQEFNKQVEATYEEVPYITIKESAQVYAFFIRRLPVDYTIASEVASNADPSPTKAAPTEAERALAAELMRAESDVPKEINGQLVQSDVRNVFGAHIIPAIDLQPMGLAAINQDSRFLWKSRPILCNEDQIAVELSSRQPDGVMPTSLPIKSVVAKQFPSISWRDLAQVGLQQIKSQLTTAYGFVSQLENAIATDVGQTMVAAKPNSNR